MLARIVVLAVVSCVALVSAAHPQAASFGPRPIYLRGSAHAWQLSFEQPLTEIFDAARKAGKKHRLSVVGRDDGKGVLRLSRGNQKGSVLDTHCTFPIVNYYGWRPVENYASAQNNALTRRRPGETLAQAGRLNGSVHITIRAMDDRLYSVQSICSAFLHEWGQVEATSLGVLETAFLADLLTFLGTPMDVPLPEVPVLEPSREDPTKDLHLAQQCMERCTPLYTCGGMFVDPETRELRCLE